MQIIKIFALRGPNIWSRHPVLEAWVDLQDLKDTPSDSVPGFNDRLMSWLPTMIEHRCSVGERGGFFSRLRDGTYPAHILEHVTLELQSLAGTPVGYGRARETATEGIYRVVVRYRDERLARACLATGRELVLAAIHDRPFDVKSEVAKLRDLADRVCLGPSTAAIVAAAEARGIPSRRLNEGSLVQLGQGAKQHRIWTAETDRTSAVAESIAQDKELTKQLLRAGGVPVPEGRLAQDAADACQAAAEIGYPVVVKPQDGNHARGVFAGLTNESQVRSAFTVAMREGSGVLVAKFAEGTEHRLLVVGGKLVAAARGDVARILGDGKSTVARLVDLQLNSDPRRGDLESCPLSADEVDTVAYRINHRFLMEEIAVIRTVCTAAVFQEFHPGHWRLWIDFYKPVFHIDAIRAAVLLEELRKLCILPFVLADDVTDRKAETGKRVRFPARSRRPMKDHTALWPFPLGTTVRLNLMLGNLVVETPEDKV